MRPSLFCRTLKPSLAGRNRAGPARCLPTYSLAVVSGLLTLCGCSPLAVRIALAAGIRCVALRFANRDPGPVTGWLAKLVTPLRLVKVAGDLRCGMRSGLAPVHAIKSRHPSQQFPVPGIRFGTTSASAYLLPLTVRSLLTPEPSSDYGQHPPAPQINVPPQRTVLRD